MLFALKRWWPSPQQTQPHPACSQAANWANGQGHTFRNVSAEGFVVDGLLRGANLPSKVADAREVAAVPHWATTEPIPWRMEWGPSNRHYIAKHELRIRSEPVLDTELQLLVMNRGLKEQMERSVFELFVEGVQTRIDTGTPPEMRWLVLLPSVPNQDLSGLGEEWVAVASHKLAMLQWVGVELAHALAQATDDPHQPLVLMVGRGQLSLRTELAQTKIDGLQGWFSLFETALRAAQRLGALVAPAPPGVLAEAVIAGAETI